MSNDFKQCGWKYAFMEKITIECKCNSSTATRNPEVLFRKLKYWNTFPTYSLDKVLSIVWQTPNSAVLTSCESLHLNQCNKNFVPGVFESKLLIPVANNASLWAWSEMNSSSLSCHELCKASLRETDSDWYFVSQK